MTQKLYSCHLTLMISFVMTGTTQLQLQLILCKTAGTTWHHWPLHENPSTPACFREVANPKQTTTVGFNGSTMVNRYQKCVSQSGIQIQVQQPVHRCFAMLGASLACDGSAAPHVEGPQPCDRRYGVWMGMGYSLPSLPYLGLGDLGIPGSVWNLAIAPNYMLI